MRRIVGLLAVVVALLVAQPAGAVLEGGTAGPTVAAAVVATGRLSVTEDRFFQTYSSTGDGWRLSTPAGVATNGGIVLSGPDAAAIAVLPYFASHVTALVPTNNGRPAGRGVAAAALAASPSALALAPDGRAAAVLLGGQLVSGSLGAWKTVTDRAALARSEPACALKSVGAVAFGVGGRLILGGRCAGSGWSGLFAAGADGRWRAMRAPAGFAGGTVVSLRNDARSPAALVVSGGRDRRLAAASLGRDAGWGRSVRLRPRESICSTANSSLRGGGSIFAVALCGGGSGRVLLLVPGARAPSPLQIPARLPKGARAVAFGPAASSAADRIVTAGSAGGLGVALETFAVDGRHVQPLSLSADARRWMPDGGAVVLSLPYGSSR